MKEFINNMKQTIIEQLIGLKYNNKKITGVSLLENKNGFQVMYDDITTDLMSVKVAHNLIESYKKKESIELINDKDYMGPAIIIKNTIDALYIDLGKNRVILEPNFKDQMPFAIYPEKVVDFFYDLNQKIDLIQIYKDWYNLTYNTNWDKELGR